MLLLVCCHGRLLGPVIQFILELFKSLSIFRRIIRLLCCKTSTRRPSLDLSLVPVLWLIMTEKMFPIVRLLWFHLMSCHCFHTAWWIETDHTVLALDQKGKVLSVHLIETGRCPVAPCVLCRLILGQEVFYGRTGCRMELRLRRRRPRCLSPSSSKAAPGWTVRRLLDTLLVRLATSLHH